VLARLPGFDPVLPRQLQAGLDRLRAARKEVQFVEVAGQGGGELAGELFHRAVGECRRREVAELARLPCDGVGDLGVRVAQVGYVGTPHRVEVALALLVDEPTSLPAHDPRVGAPELAVEDVAVRIAIRAAHGPESYTPGPGGD